jgi:6-phosphogluconate dehydrogenase
MVRMRKGGTMTEELGIVGLGRMGGGLAAQALQKGLRVVGLERGGVSAELTEAGLIAADDASAFRMELMAPRAVFLYIPAGAAIDEVIAQLEPHLETGDVIVDGGNSYWGDSVRREARLRERGLHFVDLGTSGGVSGARSGACFMAGGESAAVTRIEPILKTLAVEGGYAHAGPPGAGHFTKLVHNGIEFGMLQAIGEGIALLERQEHRLNIEAVLHSWRHGSVIRGWLIELMEEAYRDEAGLDRIPPYVDDTGEVNWLVDDAMRMEVPVPVIAQSVMQLIASRDADKPWSKAIAMMRHGFGGHPYGPNEAIASERQESRLDQFPSGWLK